MARKTNGYVPLVVVAICSMTFFVSLWLPGLNYSRNPANGPVESYPGGALLLLGWLEAMGLSVRGIAWLANPCYFLGVILLIVRRFGWATLSFGLAAGLASASFNVKSVIVDEAGHEAVVVGLGSGFWLWYSTILASCVASLVFWIQTKAGLTTKALSDV